MVIAIVIIALVVLLFVFCIFTVGKQEDERMDRIYKKYMEDENNEER